MQVDDPPYLSVGTAVSAKYKGAFCEAKVSKVVRVVKCKVTYKMGLGNATVSDEQIKGTLRVGQLVQVKHPEKKELVEATITKIQDCSQYTVVFDDGDITTLRRTALCLKSGRHFNESETLDQLPLTHPEHFGNPVVGGRRGRRNRLLKEDSSDGEIEEENEPDLEGYTVDIGRVVSVEATDKKRNKDNWFPGLVVIPSAQPTVRINVKDEFLVRSFKDGRYYTVPKKEVTEFNRDHEEKVESPALLEAVKKAVKYLDNSELPAHWERSSLFNSQNLDSDSEENLSDSSDDEPCEEKDRFVAQLYKFMDEAGTPLNKTPTVGNKDIDLHRLFRIVHKLGGYNRVTNQNKWRSVTIRLHLPHNQNTFNQVKSIYKKCLCSFESFNRTLGVTMLNHPRTTKKNRGRSLIRDKDRATPVNSPKPDKEEELPEKKEEVKEPPVLPEVKPKRKPEVKKDDDKKKKEVSETSDTCSSDATDQSESVAGPSREVGRPKRFDKLTKDKKPKPPTGEKVKAIIEKFEEQVKKDDEDKTQQTRSKAQHKQKEAVIIPPVIPVVEKKPEPKPAPSKEVNVPKPQPPKTVKKPIEDDKKRGRKRTNPEDKDKPSTSEAAPTEVPPATAPAIHIGDKLKVYYGPTHESKVTYEAKVIEIDKEASGPVFLVHYTGWNTRYDEWISPSRIAENLSAATKAKRLKQSAASGGSKSTSVKVPAKRGRGVSISGRSSVPETPRSTTPSSVTSSSSRTKSPATPATRSTSRLTTRQDSRRTRRTSAQTDASNHSDSDSDVSESETELTRTRSGGKSDEVEVKTYKRKTVKPPLSIIKPDKLKDDVDTEKEEDSDKSVKRIKKTKKASEKSADESEDDTSPQKGRDFDLNQIRSELKGFTKAMKVSPVDPTDKDAVSSSDDSNIVPPEKPPTDEPEEKKEEPLEKSSSSDDIYEFKEPEPFEFESRPKLADDKNSKKRLVPRLFEDLEKTPPKKKIMKSPGRSEPQRDSPEVEKKRFRRTSLRKQDDSEEDEIMLRKEEDPFDKLVESPSFNLVKTATEKLAETKAKIVRNIIEEPMSLFRELQEPMDESSRELLLSDSESQTQQIFSRPLELFSDPSGLDLFPLKSDEGKLKYSDDEDIQRQIQRAIQQNSSTDDDSSDALLITPSTSSYQGKKRDESSSKSEETEAKPACPSLEVKSDAPAVFSVAKQISPALQETDSSLLESICSKPVVIKLDDVKDINVKTGTKIADSILQKFNSIKNKIENKTTKTEVQVEKKEEVKVVVPTPTTVEVKAENIKVDKLEEPADVKTETKKLVDVKSKPEAATPPRFQGLNERETRKRRKAISRPYILESDSDSSDSEQLVIRSDEDSRTNSLDNKTDDVKESDSNLSGTQIPSSTDDSQTPEEPRNFKFEEIKTEEKSPTPAKASFVEEIKQEKEVKEEEPDPHLHTLLLCEETLPRSPAPCAEESNVVEVKPTKSALEMPFASAPGSSNSKSVLLEHKSVAKIPAQAVVPPVVPPERDSRSSDAAAVLENTPPTTPESSISNLSPRGENGDLSPNTADNESCKSNEVENEYSVQRRNSAVKVTPYSEEDTQMTGETSAKKTRDEPAPTTRKRRKSFRGPEEVPAKRGRKPLNRSRHNSDSDDTSEHSNTGSTNLSFYERNQRSPRPSKYNFYVEFDPSLDSSQRIAVLQQKLSELRKTYADVKTELAAVERRRKKIKRREREAQKASKQELACA